MRKVTACIWRPATGVALGVFALSVVAVGETRLRSAKHGLNVDAINQRLPAGQRVLYVEPPLAEEDYVLPPRYQNRGIERLPAGVSLVNIQQLDSASVARGATATGFGVGDPAVYSAHTDSGYFVPVKSADLGTFHANGQIFDATLFSPGDSITAYEFVVFNSSGGPSGPAEIDSELWTGDPLSLLDTTCGDPAVPIAGTACNFTGIPDGAASPCPVGPGGTAAQPCAAVPHLRCELPAKTVINCDKVWMVWQPVDSGGGCRLGWRLHSTGLGVTATIGITPPNIGDAKLWLGAFDCGQNNTCTGADAGGDGNDNCANPANGRNCGLCCDNSLAASSGMPCDDTDGTADCAHPTFCTDGTAEQLFASVYAPGDGYYAAYIATIWTTPLVSIITVPTGNAPDGADAGVEPDFVNGASVRNGNELVLNDANSKTWAFLEYRIEDWDAVEGTLDDNRCPPNPDTPDPTDVLRCERIRAYQVALDVASFTSGSAGTLAPKFVPCSIADNDPDTGANAACVNAFGAESACDSPAGCTDATGCACEFIVMEGGRTTPSRYVFISPPNSILKAPDLVGFRFGATLNQANPVTDPDPYPATNLYLGHVILDVPSDARGTFTISMDPGNTNVTRETNDFIPLLGLRPGLITIETGKCCRGIGSPQGDETCEDGLLAKQCTGLGTKYTAGGSCTGDIALDCPACTSHADCADTDACTIDRCSDFTGGDCSNTPVAQASGTCCDSTTTEGSAADVNGTGAICTLDDGEVCTVDTCSVGPSRGVCNHVCTAGIGCNDGNPCTYADLCDANCGCTGSNVNDVTCTSSADCLAATGTGFDCIQGLCFCTIAPVCGFSDVPACVEAGDKISVELRLGPAASVINGVQITVSYDPSCLDFNSIVPAGSVIAGNPYVTEIEEIVDEAHGKIFYAVGVDPLGGMGTNGNSAVAVLSFTKVGSCNACSISCGGGANPQDSLAVDSTGQPVFIDPGESDLITAANDVDLSVPGDEKVNVDCDANTAIVSWGAPSASTDCPGGANLSCSGSHSSGYIFPAGVVQNGGEMPIGTSTFCCTASEAGCGNSTQDCWTVTVNEQTSLDVTVQLSPIITGELDRCITFQMYSDCTQAPLEFTKTLHFGGLFDHIGHFTDTVKIPDAGQWHCITARDQLHTLRACDFLECVNGDYIAVFKGDPFFGGNWLVGGNLDGWKKFNPNASHNVIDILDFGQFVANFGSNVDADTPCPTAVAGHADLNGDGVVNSLDYAFVTRNFLASSKDCCCPGSAAAGSVARTEISVRELRDLDLADLAVADLNRDGVLNTADMEAFMAGQTPIKTTRPNTGSLRSGKR